ncbi:MAG: restriction endonuclease subunit S [Geobacteraceae bacterium]|nr:restriction endonuclease subunit S [Geobacteraceae bacterium]
MKPSFKKISELGRVITGKTPPTSRQECFDGEYLFVTPTDLNYDHYYCRATERTVSEEAKAMLANQFIPVDSVMFTCIGATIGKCGIASSECLTNQQINSIVAYEYTDPKFLYYLLCQNIESVKGLGGGSATPIVSKSKFEDIVLGVPSFHDQQRIASILSTYDDLIENNRRRMALLEDAARQVYQEWFVRLRFPGYEHTRIVDGVPEGWKKCLISDLGDVVTGKTPSTKEEDNYGGDIMFVKTPDMHGNVYVLHTETCLTEKGANCQSGKFLPPESILVSCIGTVGVVSLTSERCQFNQQINALIPCKESLRYYCFFAFKDLKPRLDAIGGGVTMANVSKGKFESLDIMRPVSRLLRNFDDICRPVFKQIRTLSLQNQKLRTARDLLLPKLMNGEIAV